MLQQTPSDVERNRAGKTRLRADYIMAIAATSLAVFAVVFVVSFVVLNREQETSLREVNVTRQARFATYGLIQASIDVESGQRGYLLTGDRAFLGPYERGKVDAATELGNLHAIAEQNEELNPDLTATELKVNAAIASIDHTLALQQQRPLTRAQLIDQLNQSKDQMDAARTNATALLRHVERIIDQTRVSNAGARFGIYLLGGLLGVLTILAVSLSFWALRQERKSWGAAIAALEEANEAAEIARAKAAASDLAKTRFLATASHDMRQPLHALTLYLSALKRRVDSAEAKDILAKMERAANSLVGMFSTLLDLARIQAGVIAPDPEDFPVQEIIDRIIAEQPEAAITGPKPPSTFTAHTDPLLLERLLRNLVSNALRHGGGAATIKVTPASGHALITVADRGPGIPAEDQERIFDEFTRLDARGGAEGLGLGLAICKRISDLLELDLTLESAPSQGSEFSVTVPGALDHRAVARTPESEPRLDRVKILLVDDDPHALEAAASALRDAGASTHECGGDETVDALLATGFKPDLLVMDLRIDGQLRGIDIANRLRRQLNPAPPAIIITGDTAADTLSMLRASGYAWLIKPVDRRALIDCAAEQLPEAVSSI